MKIHIAMSSHTHTQKRSTWKLLCVADDAGLENGSVKKFNAKNKRERELGAEMCRNNSS